MAISSNPRMAIRERFSCGCERTYEGRYQDNPPEVGDHRRCTVHGDVEINQWWRRSR